MLPAPSLIAGFGCTSTATQGGLFRALDAQAPHRITAIACPEARAALLAPLATALGLPLITLPRAALHGIETPTHSARALSAYGTGSVAEACALVAAGPGARLLVARWVSECGQVTCAIARGAE